jgi:hypothetical protein
MPFIHSLLERTHNRYDLRQQRRFNARVYISRRFLDGHEKVVVSSGLFHQKLKQKVYHTVYTA